MLATPIRALVEAPRQPDPRKKERADTLGEGMEESLPNTIISAIFEILDIDKKSLIYCFTNDPITNMKLNLSPIRTSPTLAQKIATTALVALAASQAHGALTVVTQINNDALPSFLQPLAGDLLETSVASFTGENAGALVRNGSVTDLPGTSTATFPAQVWGPLNSLTNATTTYTFDTTLNTFGYDITAIQAYSAWDATRHGQSYQLFYALVGAPTTFLTLGTNVLATASGTFTNASVITRTQDNVLGTSLLSGVASIRFVHATSGGIDTNPGTGTVYRELDVEGFASIPEPTTSVLGLCASALLLRRRRA